MLPINVEMVPLMCTLLSVPVLEYGTLTLIHWSVLSLMNQVIAVFTGFYFHVTKYLEICS